MKSQQADRRIQRSKQALQTAMIALMGEKEFQDITVTEIVRRAELNRGTFYKHYQYKEELLEELLGDIIADLVASYREPYKQQASIDVRELTASAIKIFEHVEKHASFYTLVLQARALAGFQNRIGAVLRDLVLQDLHQRIPHLDINQELHCSYQAYAILGMIVEWINSGFKYSSGYMAEQLLAILRTAAPQ